MASKKPVRRKKATANRAVVSIPKKNGRPPFVPTNEQRGWVEQLIAFGLTHEQIALLMINPQTGKPMTRMTLEKYFAHELATGGAKIGARVGLSLVRRALDMSHPQGATCAIFYAKTRLGWREESKVVHDVDGDRTVGVLVVPANVDPSNWIAAQDKKNAGRRAPDRKDDGDQKKKPGGTKR